MRGKRINKSVIIGVLIAIAVCVLLYVLTSSGIITFETFGSDNETVIKAYSVDELEDGCFYILHNNVFQKCPTGDVNWRDNSYAAHTLWFTSANDIEVPTLYPGDEIIFVSSTYVPYEGINWEHFADYGYTIGVANMEGDKSGHYRIINNGEGDYGGYIYANSDAAELERYVNIDSIFLDKVGSKEIREECVTAGGTVSGLEKDESYVCEWYTGTYYQDYEMTANIRTFGTIETFITYEYEFLHSRCIAIPIPEWLLSGYYYLDEIGLFRYVSAEDADNYNGEPYDPAIDWNEPIIIRDENGLIVYDPTNEQLGEKVESNTESDAGAEEYEDITGETIMP